MKEVWSVITEWWSGLQRDESLHKLILIMILVPFLCGFILGAAIF